MMEGDLPIAILSSDECGGDQPPTSFDMASLGPVAHNNGLVPFSGSAGGYLLLFQESVNLNSVLIALLVLACPLMHMLMHRGHGKH